MPDVKRAEKVANDRGHPEHEAEGDIGRAAGRVLRQRLAPPLHMVVAEVAARRAPRDGQWQVVIGAAVIEPAACHACQP